MISIPYQISILGKIITGGTVRVSQFKICADDIEPSSPISVSEVVL